MRFITDGDCLHIFLSRCKRLHPMLATAFHILHFRKFLEDTGPIPDVLQTKLATFQDAPCPEEMEYLEMTEEYISFMVNYAGYMELTLAGAHGSTA